MKLKECFFCNKHKYTPYHMTEIHANGVIESCDMCKECGWELIKDAYEPMKKPKKPNPSPNLTEIKSPHDLLSLIVSMVIPPKPTQSTKPNCTCGMSAVEFEEHGKFGCPQCYDHFSEYMEQLVSPYHGADEHVGKRPKCPSTPTQELSHEDQLKILKLRLAKAIEVEKYEQAAEINAQIKILTDPSLRPTSSDQ